MRDFVLVETLCNRLSNATCTLHSIPEVFEEMELDQEELARKEPRPAKLYGRLPRTNFGDSLLVKVTKGHCFSFQHCIFRIKIKNFPGSFPGNFVS